MNVLEYKPIENSEMLAEYLRNIADKLDDGSIEFSGINWSIRSPIKSKYDILCVSLDFIAERKDKENE